MTKSNRTSKLKKKRIFEDRISNLPESIVAYILSFLPTKDAVATSLLSRSWRVRWTRVTSFDFDDRTGRVPNGNKPEKNFVEFVNMVLLNHRAEFIKKFRLKWMILKLASSYLKIWANTAIARNVQVLDLDILCPWVHELPSALYTCGTLEVLKLQGPILVKVPHLVCLPKLSVLGLSRVRYESDECFRKLISGCPVLRSLKILWNHFIDNLFVCIISSRPLKRLEIYSDYVFVDKGANVKLVIDTPALEYLQLHDSACWEISIQGQTSVNEVDLDILCRHRGQDSTYLNMIVELVEGFDHATYMKLSRKTVYALSTATYQFAGNFKRLTKLVIHLDRREWSTLMELIGGCLKLEVLEIAKVLWGRSGHWRDPIRVPRCLLSSLRRVSFEEFYGAEDEIAMLKYILEHGLVMERVHLNFSPNCFKGDLSCAPPDVLLDRFKKKFHVLNKVSMLSRASPTCKISWDESCESWI